MAENNLSLIKAFTSYTQKMKEYIADNSGSGNDNSNSLPITGGTMEGALIAQSNTDYTVAQVRNVTMSTSAASGGRAIRPVRIEMHKAERYYNQGIHKDLLARFGSEHVRLLIKSKSNSRFGRHYQVETTICHTLCRFRMVLVSVRNKDRIDVANIVIKLPHNVSVLDTAFYQNFGCPV